MLSLKRYICVKQHDEKDCGAACLATISKHYGLKVPISKIREIAGTDKQGTNVYGLIKAAEHLGFSAKGVKANPDALKERFPLPAIAHVVIDGKLLHYVVIHEIRNDKMIIADPGKGIVKYKIEEFLKIWTGILILMVPSETFKKEDQIQSTFSRFSHVIFAQKSLLTHIIIASFIITLFGILGAFYFQIIIDEILPNGIKSTLHIISIGLIIMYLFQVILSAFRQYLLLYLGQRLSISIMLGYYNHVLKLPLNFFGTRKVGEIISRFTDANKVIDAISSAALTVILDVIMIIIVGGVLYFQSPTLFGVTLCLIPIYIAIVWGFFKSYDKINKQEMENNAQLTAKIVESLNGIETVKSYNSVDKVNTETEKQFVKYLKSVFKHGLIDTFQTSLKSFLELAGGALILWIGATKVLDGSISIGQLITFNALLTYFLDPLQNLINLQPKLQSAAVAAERLGEILDIDQEILENEEHKITNPELIKAPVTFNSVDFRYGTRNLVLKSINININPGEKIAFVGESGSGKSTLVKLIMNFYSPEKGEILINGININDIHRNTLREKIAFIPQEAFFFSGTILENLMLSAPPNTSMEDIVNACKIARAHEFINKLPLRYETILEENASNLSGGQKQRLAIARAFLKQPSILIMDESTSNLDSSAEKAILEYIYTRDDITTIFITHRLSTIMRCDRIYVMENGEIVEEGSHDELMNKQGHYYKLWQNQIPSVTEPWW
jgi:ATP-binding cassette, subfamily C, bacteriocin exporter